MKTDRFADIIRRKLDSIRPEFSDREWEKMQATLTKAGVTPNIPVQTAHPFAGVAAKLAVVGAIGTTVFLTTSIWQHYELKHLRQSLEQATNSVESVRTTDSSTNLPITDHAATLPPLQNAQNGAHATEKIVNVPEAAHSVRRDTVYIDRYVTVPTTESPLRLKNNTQPSRSQDGNLGNAQAVEFGKQRINPGSSVTQRVERTPSKPADEVDVSVRNEGQLPGSTGQPADQATSKNQRAKSSVERSDIAASDKTRSNPQLPTSAGTSSKDGGRTTVDTPTETTSAQQNDGSTTSSSDGSNQPETVYESLASLPLQQKTIRWNDIMALRARQMRPARTVVVNSSPQTPTVQKPATPFIAKIRVGAGADVNKDALSGGVYSEVLLGNRFSLSVGLSQARFSGTTFKGEKEFNERNREDFRKDFARGIDQKFAIINIESKSTRIQIPINLGYRIPLTQSLALLPSVGTNLNLQAKEYISFIQILTLPYPIYKLVNAEVTRPIDLFNNVNVGAGIEWRQRHWVAQASPVLTLPLQTMPFCNENTTVGLRARLFYQF
ncbi:hypothetical protein GCM10028806_31470 [Spirosoma terrae]|uniref:Uncharacterized protein n=1 Tax=Spirosoma terrae TaxID=1968276 RepID=A0A6L9L8K1_9BACT|nr:hypothetical protein [Spirosoma terrae]NDU95461.1 hypothetical protein [Spirosoma terrae]